MALCENCICYDSCKDWADQYNDIEFPYGYCTCYKPKDRFIELPCAVGDTVYVILYAPISKTYYIREISADMIISINGYFYVKYNGKNLAFGEKVFVTKEEAEKALENKQ